MRATLVAIALLGCSGGGGDKDQTDTGGTTTAVQIDPDRIVTDTWPSKRSEILAGAHLGTNSIVIFGGNDGPIVNQIPSAVFRDDTWVFEPGTGWTEVTGDGPRKRGRYAMSVDEAGNRALLYGGRFRVEGESGDYTLFNDLWSFDFLTRTWTEVHDGSGQAPPPTYYPASAYDPSAGLFYVWGGAANTDPLVIEPIDELWAWDGSGWEEVPTTGDAPSTRTFLGSTYDEARNRLIIFGGQRGDFTSLAFNDTYALDLTTMTWEQLHDGFDGKAPSTRMHAHMVVDAERDRYLLFGGHTDIGDMNDLWAFDPNTNKWDQEYIADKFDNTELGCIGNPAEVPSDYVTMDLSALERRHRGMYAIMHDNLWVFAGIHAECSDQLDDTWRYDLTGKAWHELIEATSGEACLRRADDCECLCI